MPVHILLILVLICSGHAAMADVPLPVEILRAGPAPRHFNIELTGTLEAAQSIPVAFRSGGRVISVAVELGAKVQPGQLLAQVDPAQAQAAAYAAEAQLAAARAGVTQANLALARSRDVLARGAGTRADLDIAQEAALTAEAARDQAAAQLAKASQAVKDTRLTAPVAGIVTAREAEPGQIAPAGQPILTIAPDDRREAVFFAPNVPELDGLLGRRLVVVPMDSPALRLSGEISEVSPLADETTGTVRVRVQIFDPSELALLGGAVTAKIDLPHAAAVALPWSALADKDGAPAVWTVSAAEGGRVTLRPITLFDYSTDGFAVSAGIDLGQAVVGAGSHLLFPGREVVAAGVTALQVQP